MSNLGEFTGTVKWFNEAKGYGFASRDGHEKDVFIHAGELRKSGVDASTLQEGDEVRFDISETPRGAKAVNLSRI